MEDNDLNQDPIVLKLSTTLMLGGLIANYSLQAAQAKFAADKEGLDNEIKRIYNDQAKLVIDSLTKSGYSIVPTEKIPDAFLNS